MVSLVDGTFSATTSMNTEYERRTVMDRATFSPESGGSQKTMTLMHERNKQGVSMLTV
jgi:hypothetical protein